MVGDWTIKGWADIGSIVTAIGLLLGLASLAFASYQLRVQNDLTASQVSLAALLKFYEMYGETAALRQQIESRHSAGDQNLNKHDVMQYYTRYWLQRKLEWEYFAKGLLSNEIFAVWCEDSARHITNSRNLRYYYNGEECEIQSRQVFETYVMGDLFLRSEACRSFYTRLFNLVRDLENHGMSIETDAAFARLQALVVEVRGKRTRPRLI